MHSRIYQARPSKRSAKSYEHEPTLPAGKRKGNRSIGKTKGSVEMKCCAYITRETADVSRVMSEGEGTGSKGFDQGE